MEQTTAPRPAFSALSADVAEPVDAEPSGLNEAPSDTPIRPDPEAPHMAARALLAWMALEPASLMLMQGRQSGTFTAEMQQRWHDAHAARQQRTEPVDQSDLIRPLPRDLASYVTRLEKNPQARQYFDEGWQPALVDLPRVCAFQPHVFVEHAQERVAEVNVRDQRALAEVTLPLSPPDPVTFQYDRRRQQFVTSIGGPNLQIVGAFGGLAQGMPVGTVHMGFQLRVVTSFMQVGAVQGACFLRDGYHRALGLVARGARYVPAFVRDNMTMSDLIAPGALEFEAIMGSTPPVISDYWDDQVSVSVELPAPRRVISIQASELSVYG
jgi:hypothetical protein